MSKRVVITGVGVVHPLGHSLAQLVAHLGQAPSAQTGGAMTVLEKGDIVWTIKDLLTQAWIQPRLQRKIDPFCTYGIAAAIQALESAELDVQSLNPYEIGMCIGNMLGGWEYIEGYVCSLHSEGVSTVSPYVATAWFPAALQGQISLLTGIQGYSKTFSTIQVAGLQAMGYAAEAIRNGRASIMLCGASEALTSSYVQALLHRFRGAEKPLLADMSRQILGVFAEGAAFVVLEDFEPARSRGARILAEIGGFQDSYSSRNRFDETAFGHSSHSVMKELLGQQFSVGGVTICALLAAVLGEMEELAPYRYSLMLEPFRQSQQHVLTEINYLGHQTTLTISATHRISSVHSTIAQTAEW